MKHLTEITPFIAGKAATTASEERHILVSPACGEPIIEIPSGCDKDIEVAVSSARATFEEGGWSGLSPSQRCEFLLKFADLVASEASQFDQLDAFDMGKPVRLT